MDIKFLLPDKKTIIDDPYQIPNIKKKNYLLGYLIHLKLLELNKKFENKVYKTRSMYGIPERGIPYSEFEKLKRSWKKAKKTNSRRQREINYNGRNIPIIGFEKLIVNDFKTFLRKDVFNNFNLLGNISDIILFGIAYVDPDLLPIAYYYQEGKSEGIPRVNIAIFGNITRNQLDNYLDNVFKDEIEKEISKLPPVFSHLPTSEQFDIFYLRKKNNLKYTEIAEIIGKKYKKKGYTYSNVSKTYSKAKESVKNLL
jgi:hypothetical protein